MSEEEKNGQGQKPKFWWMVIASPILIIVGVIIGLYYISNNLAIWTFVLWIGGALSLSVIGYYRIHKNQGRLSGKICAVLGMVLALFIFIESLTPPRPPSDRVKWSEGKAMAEIISFAIKDYTIQKGPDEDLPADNDFEALGFRIEDFNGAYFNQSTDKMFSFKVQSLNPLRYTITIKNKDLKPTVMTLDQDGVWTKKSE